MARVAEEKKPEEKTLTLGAKLIERMASEVYKATQDWRPGVPRLVG